MYLVVHVERLERVDGSIVLRIFTIPKFFDYERDVLMLGNLKILKTYDFWLPIEEIYHRIDDEFLRVENLVGRTYRILSVGGRIMKMCRADDFINYENFVKEHISRPVGVRILNSEICLAFSENLYAVAPCPSRRLDVEFYIGKIRGFLIGASVNTFDNIINKLKRVSMEGKFGRVKVSLSVDFARPIYTVST